MSDNWPFRDCCDICGESWTEQDKKHIYDNVTRDWVGSVSGYRFNEDTGVKEGMDMPGSILVTRHANQTRCLINLSIRLGVFQKED